MTTIKTRSTGIAALTLGFLATYLITAAAAVAGPYDVYACEAPTINTLNYSWGGVGTYPGYAGRCDARAGEVTNRGLVTRMVPGEGGKPSSFGNGQWSGLYFGAPPARRSRASSGQGASQRATSANGAPACRPRAAPT